MKRISVFCGSSSGFDNIYKAQATKLGQLLANQNIELVYGGANVGLMGAVAEGTLKSGGKVIGIIPNFMKSKGIVHEKITELILVDTMHERKLKMYELSDGIIALPGGYGTIEELFEILAWAQLGLHKKPIAVFNVNGFYDSLIALVQTMTHRGFLKQIHQDMILVDSNAHKLLEKMKNYTPPIAEKWIR